MVNVHKSIHVNVMSGGSRHCKRTLNHTCVRYVWMVKTWLMYIKAYTLTLFLKGQDMVNIY